MPIRATTTSPGAASFDALAVAVGRAKGGDVLAPVTVVVPTNTAGVMARRALGRRGGVAAVEVLTLYRVAELLGAPSLIEEGRRPVSTPIVDVAVKGVLSRAPGTYRDVAAHPSTVVALRDLYREVRTAGAGALAALAGTARGREPARLLAAVADDLASGWYDEGDLLQRAAAEARRAPSRRFARLVLHGVDQLRPLERQLVRSLGATGDVTFLAVVTGAADADQPVADLAGELTDVATVVASGAATVSTTGPHGPAPAGVVRVVSTTDADEEARVGVRTVLDAARGGVPFDRMAILWPADRPYARLVEHHLGAAGLPWNGRPGTAVTERIVPRVLAELLDLDRRGLRRSVVMTLLGDVPARRPDGTFVPTASWERIGRDAGLVREEDWERRLPRWIATVREAAADEERPGLAERAADGEELAAFVAGLRDVLGDRQARRPWTEWVAWCHARLEAWFGPALGRLRDAERIAWDQTQLVLDRLAHLDTMSPPVARSEFRAALMAELEVVPARRGTVGDGVHVGALSGARGLDLDVAVVLGGVDGLLPPPPAVDPLLGDKERTRAGLATSAERARHLHRQFLAVTTATPAVTVVVPRGDLRASTVHHRSRWIDALVAASAGAPDGGTASGSPSPRATVVERVIDSHAHGLSTTEFPLSAAEHRLRDLWTHVRAGGDVRARTGADDDVLARALCLRDARASDVLTAFDGDVSSRTIPLLDRPVAPTRIEAWKKCPHAYFARYVLGVRPVDEPSDVVDLSALDRGSAIHAAIDRLQRRVLAGELAPVGPTGWTAAHADALVAIAEEIADELEHGGRTGRAAFWSTSRAALVDELREWIDADRAQWCGRTLIASEHRFGADGSVVLGLPDGRSIAFQGSIDRIDRMPDGSLVVTDHKTGSLRAYQGLDQDPTNAGTHFQLPVYAAAARVLEGEPGATVRAEYSFLRKGRFRRIGVTFDDATWKQALADLADVVAGIESGLFPARPEPPGWRAFVECEYCEPDQLGTTERWPEWERKRHDPRLARWFGEDGAGVSGEVADG